MIRLFSATLLSLLLCARIIDASAPQIIFFSLHRFR